MGVKAKLLMNNNNNRKATILLKELGNLTQNIQRRKVINYGKYLQLRKSIALHPHIRHSNAVFSNKLKILERYLNNKYNFYKLH